MSRLIDLTGKRFGRWAVLERGPGGRRAVWWCTCDCGTERMVRGSHLRRGETTSCGCNQNAASVEEAFYRTFKAGPVGECWEWPGGRTAGGYGYFGHQYKMRYAHRASYEIHHGAIPDGLQVCHRCDNPPCCNPAHLFAGTPADNSADMVAKGRHRSNPVTGTDHPLAKLDEDKVRYIRSCRTSLKRLAEEFGVAHSLIYRIRHRQSWAHVA